MKDWGLNQFLLLFLGGGTGTLFRFLISQIALRFYPTFFPIGTLIVNLAGSFIIGYLGALFLSNHISVSAKLFMMTGLLGGFTTYSSFSLELVQLIQLQKYMTAVMYLMCTNVVGFLLCFLGFSLGGK